MMKMKIKAKKSQINHSQQENLASLLKTAEELRIKGLAEVSWREDECSEGGDSSSRLNSSLPRGNASTPIIPDMMPMLTPLPSHREENASNGNSSHNGGSGGGGGGNGPITATPFPGKKKRGRPPLDEEYDSFCT